jgi:predicted ATP-dependent endonuclease of OLD family
VNLKSIELIGFKSFADYQKIEFKEGITAIVGPNGCGKSNIADAIRWVLGEQKSKALRGGCMQDVIFKGTEKRKGMSFCEVSLNFDNANKTNLKVGAYHFFRADSLGIEQADNFIKNVPIVEGMLPPVVDVEIKVDNIEEIQKQLQSMLNKLEETYEKKPILYSTYEAYDLILANNLITHILVHLGPYMSYV